LRDIAKPDICELSHSYRLAADTYNAMAPRSFSW
jgi:hypothetical protein